MTGPGMIPMTRHRPVKMNMAASDQRSTSCAVAAMVVRGRPRKLTPNALTKQAAASAADNASIAPTAGTISLTPHDGTSGLKRIAWKVSHSETKPLSGGNAEIAMHPARNVKAVSGMRWMRPPSCSMSRWPVAVRTAPEPKNSRLLKML